MIQVAPRRLPTSMENVSSNSVRLAAFKLLSMPTVRSRPMTDNPLTFFKSPVTVSAMPEPIHSSSGDFVMLTKFITAIAFLSTGAGSAEMLPVARVSTNTAVECGDSPVSRPERTASNVSTTTWRRTWNLPPGRSPTS